MDSTVTRTIFLSDHFRPDIATFESPALAHSKVAVWNTRLKRLSDTQRVDSALDAVIEFFESMFESGDWNSCREALLLVDPSKVHSAISLAILSMTLAQKTRVSPERDVFLGKVSTHLFNTCTPKDASRKLRGLA